MSFPQDNEMGFSEGQKLHLLALQRKDYSTD